MRLFPLSTLLVVACSTPDPSITEEDEAIAGLEELREASREPVVHEARRGIPAMVVMDVPVTAADPVEAALQFLEDHAAFYGLQAPRDELRVSRVSDEPDGVGVHFVPRASDAAGGLTLFDAGLQVLMADGSVKLTTGRYTVPSVGPIEHHPPVLQRDTLAGLGAQLKLANMEIQAPAELGALALWTEQGVDDVLTVWRVPVVGDLGRAGGAVSWQVDVDAETGEVVQIVDLAPDSDKSLRVGTLDGHATASCWSTPAWFYEDGPTRIYSAAADPAGDGMAAFDHAHTVYDFFEGNFDQCSFDGADAQMKLDVYLGAVNAYALGQCGSMAFGEGFATLDVVAHEFTHLVDHAHQGLNYQGLSGALDESFADVFGALIDGNWTIGEGTPLGVLRSLQDPPQYGQPDHVLRRLSGDGQGLRDPSSSADHGHVHTNSGIPNKVAYLVIEGGRHNGIVVEGIGRDKAAALYHTVLTRLLQPSADFDDARDALVGLARFWGTQGAHGFTGQESCAVANAWASVGIRPYVADADCDGIPDEEDGDSDGDGVSNRRDNCPDDPNPTQLDTDGDGMGNVCDRDDDDDGIVDRRDNCWAVPNPDQADTDGDGTGDRCDDDDRDRVLDIVDNCPGVPNWDQTDTDGDGMGDACDDDDDGDGRPDTEDDCPRARGEEDGDGDGVPDACDNCPDRPNRDQLDCDGDGVGQVCDDDASEQLGCIAGEQYVEVDVFVHPLEEVALPVLAWTDTRLPPVDPRVIVTIEGIDDDWMIVDRRGAVVGRSRVIPGRIASSIATFLPGQGYGGPDAHVGDFRLLLPSTIEPTAVTLTLELVDLAAR